MTGDKRRSGQEPGMADFKIWMNGRLVLQAEAVLPVNSAAVFYATNVFEGLRAYWNERDGELYGFRLADHFARLRESMKMMRFSVPYSDDELFEAVRAVLVANVGGAGLDATSPTGLYINPRRRQRVTEGKGVSACVSSWARTSDNAIPIRLKCGANYQNGRLAKLQAKVDGYDEPIFLNEIGRVAEGTGATFFMVRKGRLCTPTTSNDILESITRTTLIEDVAPNVVGMDVVERELDRTELYTADGAFLCGSGYEITPVTSVDRFPVGRGEVGPVTRAIANGYMNLVRGVDSRHPEWRTPTYKPVRL